MGEQEWHIYIRDNAELTLDTLVPVAEVISDMLSHYLGDAVLYVLPILTCEETEISEKLDALNVRQDQHNLQITEVTLLPTIGDIIQPPNLIYLHSDNNYKFQADEDIGWTTQESSLYRYGRVCKKIRQTCYSVESERGSYNDIDITYMRYFKRI